MKPDQNITSAQNREDLMDGLDSLLREARELGRGIDGTNQTSREDIAALDTKIDMTLLSILRRCADLDQVENEAGDEVDRHVLEQAEVLAAE